jgi:hypothetical protein
MLGSAVLVNLAGIMYSATVNSGDAATTAYYGKQRESITWMIMLVIIVSVIYYLTVLCSEMFKTCLPRCCPWLIKASEKLKDADGNKETELQAVSDDGITFQANPLALAKMAAGSRDSAKEDEASALNAALAGKYKEALAMVDSLQKELSKFKKTVGQTEHAPAKAASAAKVSKKKQFGATMVGGQAQGKSPWKEATSEDGKVATHTAPRHPAQGR